MFTPQTRLWFGFVLSAFFSMLPGIDVAFNTYALALKETFNLTQFEVELVGSMSSIGIGLSGLETILTAFLGYTVTCWFTMVLIPLSTAAYALISMYANIFEHWPALICLIQLCLSTGVSVGYVAISRVCVENLAVKHSGKLVAFYASLMSVAKILYTILIQAVNGDLHRFFLVICLWAIVFCPITFYFLVPFAKQQDGGKDDDNQQLLATMNDRDEKDSRSAKAMLQSPLFHVVLWSSTLLYGFEFSTMNNITTIAKSILLENPLTVIYVMSATMFFARILFGIIVDQFISATIGLGLLMFCYLAFSAGLLVGIIELNIQTIYVMTFFISAGMGPTRSTAMATIIQSFGREYYSAVTGIFFLITMFSQSLIQLLFGIFYESAIVANSFPYHNCYGSQCFYWSFVIMFSFSLTSVIVVSILLMMYLRKSC